MSEIETLWAILADDDSNPPWTEGVVAHLFDVGHAQLITNNERLVPMLVRVAQEIATGTGRRLRLVRFERSHVVQEIAPGGAPSPFTGTGTPS